MGELAEIGWTNIVADLARVLHGTPGVPVEAVWARDGQRCVATAPARNASRSKRDRTTAVPH